MRYVPHAYNVLHVHVRLYLSNQTAEEEHVTAHSLTFVCILFEFFLTARRRAIPVCAQSVARSLVNWFLRLWMFMPTDATSRVYTGRARSTILTTLVFREQLLVFVLKANVTPALSFLACVGFLTDSPLAAGLRAIPRGAKSAARIVYWALLLWMCLTTDAAGRVCTCHA